MASFTHSMVSQLSPPDPLTYCLSLSTREQRDRALGYRKRGPKPKRLFLQVSAKPRPVALWWPVAGGRNCIHAACRCLVTLGIFIYTPEWLLRKKLWRKRCDWCAKSHLCTWTTLSSRIVLWWTWGSCDLPSRRMFTLWICGVLTRALKSRRPVYACLSPAPWPRNPRLSFHHAREAGGHCIGGWPSPGTSREHLRSYASAHSLRPPRPLPTIPMETGGTGRRMRRRWRRKKRLGRQEATC